jgi:hypothetical protein
MAETEGVSRFKEFARAELLTALRGAGGDELQKEQVYLQVLRPTQLGRAILRLPPPFRDTPETRALIEAVQAAQHDEERSAPLRQLLDEFQDRFPPDRLRTMSVEQYVMGGGDRNNFCWWLERGLQRLGRYMPGSSRGHLIYRTRKGEIYRVQFLKDMSLEEAMAQVARWHAQVVEIGGGPDPEQIDEGAAGWTGMPSRTLKLLHSYFPDRFLPINSIDHLARFLRAFGVPEDAVPDGAVARNRLLFSLFEALGRPPGLDAEEFMQILYERFDPVRSPLTRRGCAARSVCSLGTMAATALPTASCARSGTTRWRSPSGGSRRLMSTISPRRSRMELLSRRPVSSPRRCWTRRAIS